jgi:fimbrial isopeptide formation D2 family protein
MFGHHPTRRRVIHRRSRRAGRWGLAVLLASMLATAGALSSPVAAAGESFGTSVSISAVSPTTQKSGSAFTYEVEYTCSALDVGGQCEDYRITIPLDDLTDTYTDSQLESMFAVRPADGTTLDVSDGVLTISLGTVPLGNDTLQLSFTPPNYTTPDGTHWELAPTSTATDATSDTGAPVQGTATATVNHTINKSVVGSAFKKPNETVTYRVQVACSQPGTGTVLASSMKVVDSLPAGLEFVSADHGGTDTGGTVTWNLPGTGEPMPASCTDAGATGTLTLTVTARVKAAPETGATAPGDAIDNTATVTSVDADGKAVAAKDDGASITILDPDDPTPPGRLGFSKESFGQLRDRCDAETETCTPGTSAEDQSHTTYAGNWMGVRADQPQNVLNGYRPNQATGMRQAGYKMQFTSGVAGGSGWEPALRDPVPCLTNTSEGTQVYSSNASWQAGDPVSDLCQSPAFHVRTVSVWTDSAGDTPDLAAGYVPVVRYSDGTSAPMTKDRGSAHDANFSVPAGGGTIAQIEFPRTAGLSGPTTRWGVFGFVDGDAATNTVVRNRAVVDAFWREDSDTAAPRRTLTDTADLFVISEPQIGVEKSFGARNDPAAGQSKLTLTGRLLTPSVTKDLQVTDLLPTGMRVSGALPAGSATVYHVVDGDETTHTSTVPAGIETVDNFRGTGRQLVRITVAQSDMNAFNIGKVELSRTITVAYVDEPTTYSNTAQAFYDDPSLSGVCQQVPSNLQEPSDPLDLSGDGDTNDNNCTASASLTIPPVSGAAKYAVTKTVQGDRDAAPRPFPGVGVVSEDGGTAQFGLGWKNTGGTTLQDAVLYDILPRVGDTGVGADFATKPRNSAFTPVYAGYHNPDAGHLTVAFTRSDNPCRPEVYADNPGCDDDWSTTEPSPAEYGQITGVRIVSDRDYTPGQGFVVTVDMTVPPLGDEPGDVAPANSIAWNSVAGRASNADGSPRLAISPPKVGITASSDPVPLLLSKELDDSVDASAVKPGDTVVYHLSVTNPNATTRTIDAVDALPSGLAFDSIAGDTAGTPDTAPAVTYDSDSRKITWDALQVPAGATLSWTVTTTVRPGVTGTQVNSFSSDGGTSTGNPCPDDPDGECVSIDVDSAQLTVAKTVAGEGAEFARGPFAVNVTCRVDDTVVTDKDLTLDGDGDSEDVAVPYGSTCTVVETDDGAATSSTISPATPVAIVNGTASYTVDITNTYDVGALVINKRLTGVGAAQLGDGPFTFGVVCRLADDKVFDDSVTLRRSGDEVALTSDPITGLPIGAECVVTETDNGGADATPDPVTVTIAKDPSSDPVDTVVAELSNSFSAGTVSVEKQVEGDEANSAAVRALEFTVQVTCQIDSVDEDGDPVRATLFSGATVLKAGTTIQVTDDDGEPRAFPLGTHCFADETDDGGADRSVVSHGSFDDALEVVSGAPDDLQPLNLTVVNTFRSDPPAPGTGDDGDGLLPDTGGPVLTALLGGLLLAVAGATILGVTRRRRTR